MRAFRLCFSSSVQRLHRVDKLHRQHLTLVIFQPLLPSTGSLRQGHRCMLNGRDLLEDYRLPFAKVLLDLRRMDRVDNGKRTLTTALFWPPAHPRRLPCRRRGHLVRLAGIALTYHARLAPFLNSASGRSRPLHWKTFQQRFDALVTPTLNMLAPWLWTVPASHCT